MSTPTLSDVAAALDGARETMGTLTDAELIDALKLAGHLKRLIDAAVVDLAGEATSRCRPHDLTSLDAARGYHNPKELL